MHEEEKHLQAWREPLSQGNGSMQLQSWQAHPREAWGFPRQTTLADAPNAHETLEAHGQNARRFSMSGALQLPVPSFSFSYRGVGAIRLASMAFKRLRPSLGTGAGFMLMALAAFGLLEGQPLVAAASFLLICLASDLYNDYCDYDEDMRNGRREKFTTSGVISLQGTLGLSLLLLALALLMLAGNARMLAFSVFAAAILFSYSHPAIRLKKFNIAGYAVFASVFLLIPIAIVSGFAPQYGTGLAVPLSAFLFFQTLFILCQKDSTDKLDSTNLFLARGKSASLALCALFAFLSLASLFWLSLSSPALFVLVAADFLVKAAILIHIHQGPVKSTRSNLVLLEHIVPYAFVAVMLCF